MAAEWPEIRLGDLVARGALAISDGYRVRNEELGPEGIPFVRGGDIGNGWINTNTIDHIRTELAARVEAKLARPGDVAFITKGTVGRAGRLLPGQPPVVFAPQVAYWRVLKPDVLDSSFLFYLIRSHAFQAALDGVKTHGSMVADYVSISQQLEFSFQIPDIKSQNAIGRMLAALDDRIELNRRQDQTLESIARALFRAWFVDFDPVRAKADRRDPCLPRPFADLFPDSFEDSDLGQVPRGWGTHRLGDLLALDKGLSYKGEFLTDSGTPMVNLGCFLGRGGFANEAIRKYSGEYQSRHVIAPRALVLANTDITQKREVIGSPALLPPQGHSNEFIFTHHVFAARFHKGKESWKLFVYFLLLQDTFRQRAAGFATGTTVLALPRDAVLNLSCPAVPPALIHAFETAALPLLEREWMNLEASRTLAQLRDTLLPPLISGELRTKDAERIVERAV